MDDLERLLPGLDSLALVSSRPQLLGLDIRGNAARKISRLYQLLGPKTDLTDVVVRCPSLLGMNSATIADKLEKLQNVLPPGLDAR